jgi:serine/threonine-protein kinase
MLLTGMDAKSKMDAGQPENAPDSPEVDLVGRTIGEYELLRRLGRGGMAVVYLAEQKSLRRRVALKILRDEFSNDPAYIKRFHREAQAAAALAQANIVQIYEVGEVDGFHFIAQEYVRGQNLRQYLKRYGAVEAVMAVNVLRQTAMALQKAASNDPVVVHRDIKPENIMISTGGEVKVADFGLARLNDQRNKNDLTQIGITMGTPLYMSPEQVEGGLVDPRSDIYSLGITLYHMLAGKPPFEGENALAIAVQHVKNEATPLQRLRPDIPTELAELIHQMMAKQPQDRIQSPNEIVKTLRKIDVDVDDDWSGLAERIASTDLSGANIESRLAVTQQLQTVMLGKVPSWWEKRVTWLAMMFLGLCGVGIGLVTADSPKDPLHVETDSGSVTKSKTIEEQFREAQWKLVSDYDEAARYFEAVIENFPIDPNAENSGDIRRYHNMSLQQLAEIYWRTNYLDEAAEAFEKLSQLPDNYGYIRVTGIAGNALVADLAQNSDRVVAMLRDLEEMDMGYDDFLSEYFRKQVDELFIRYGPDNSAFD